MIVRVRTEWCSCSKVQVSKKKKKKKWNAHFHAGAESLVDDQAKKTQ